MHSVYIAGGTMQIKEATIAAVGSLKTKNPSFAKAIPRASLNHSRDGMILPYPFISQFWTKPSGTATLVDPGGRQWPVSWEVRIEVGRPDASVSHKMGLRRGWMEFARHHEIRDWEVLLFELTGTKTIQVQFLQRRSMQQTAQQTQAKLDYVHSRVSAAQGQLIRSGGRETAGMPKRVPGDGKAAGRKKQAVKAGRDVGRVPPNEGGGGPDEIPSGKYVPFVSMGPNVRASAEAAKRAIAGLFTLSPSLAKTLGTSECEKADMGVGLPLPFVTKYLKSAIGDITLEDIAGATWEVSLRFANPQTSTNPRIMRGWRSFVEAKGLRGGDVVLLELVRHACLRVTVLVSKSKQLQMKGQHKSGLEGCSDDRVLNEAAGKGDGDSFSKRGDRKSERSPRSEDLEDKLASEQNSTPHKGGVPERQDICAKGKWQYSDVGAPTEGASAEPPVCTRLCQGQYLHLAKHAMPLRSRTSFPSACDMPDLRERRLQSKIDVGVKSFKGGNLEERVCRTGGQACSQLCMEGYEHCMRHILEDPLAPYGTCTHTAGQPPCHRAVWKQSKLPLLCRLHQAQGEAPAQIPQSGGEFCATVIAAMAAHPSASAPIHESSSPYFPKGLKPTKDMKLNERSSSPLSTHPMPSHIDPQVDLAASSPSLLSSHAKQHQPAQGAQEALTTRLDSTKGSASNSGFHHVGVRGVGRDRYLAGIQLAGSDWMLQVGMFRTADAAAAAYDKAAYYLWGPDAVTNSPVAQPPQEGLLTDSFVHMRLFGGAHHLDALGANSCGETFMRLIAGEGSGEDMDAAPSEEDNESSGEKASAEIAAPRMKRHRKPLSGLSRKRPCHADISRNEPKVQLGRKRGSRNFGEEHESIYRGVSEYRSTRSSRFQAKVYNRFTRQLKHIGYFSSAREAALAYDVAVMQLYGDTSVLNFPADGHETESKVDGRKRHAAGGLGGLKTELEVEEGMTRSKKVGQKMKDGQGKPAGTGRGQFLGFGVERPCGKSKRPKQVEAEQPSAGDEAGELVVQALLNLEKGCDVARNDRNCNGPIADESEDEDEDEETHDQDGEEKEEDVAEEKLQLVERSSGRGCGTARGQGQGHVRVRSHNRGATDGTLLGRRRRGRASGNHTLRAPIRVGAMRRRKAGACVARTGRGMKKKVIVLNAGLARAASETSGGSTQADSGEPGDDDGHGIGDKEGSSVDEGEEDTADRKAGSRTKKLHKLGSGSTGYLGVNKVSPGKYRANLYISKPHIHLQHLGVFNTARQAAQAYDAAALKERGKGAKLNFPTGRKSFQEIEV